MSTDTIRPAWWSEHHEQAWNRARDDVRHAWEADRRAREPRDDEDSVDTVRVHRDSAPTRALPWALPSAAQPPIDRHRDWDAAEDAVRYGFGAALPGGRAWSELDLRDEWVWLVPERSWDQVKDDVRFGWSRARGENVPS